MSWGECIRLASVLQRDPSSAVAASLANWDFLITREALLLADLYDLTVMANSDPKKGRPKPHPGRPFKSSDREQQKFGDTGGRPREQIVEILNGMGHQLPL